MLWSCGDSNPVPPACKAGALPDELQPHENSMAIASTLVESCMATLRNH